MSMPELAMGTLIVVGAFTIVAVVIWMFKQKDGPTMKSIVLVILGFAMIGVGGFGPRFLHDYGSFIADLQQVSSVTDPQAQQEAAAQLVNAFAQGEYDDEDWPVIAATLQQYAVPDLEQILLDAEQTTTPTRKRAIESTREDVERGMTTLESLLDLSGVPGPQPETSGTRDIDDTFVASLDSHSLRRLTQPGRYRLDPKMREQLREELIRRDQKVRDP